MSTVRTLKNFVTPEEIQWFQDDMNEYFARGEWTEPYIEEGDNIYQMFGNSQWKTRDRRHVLTANDIGYKKMADMLRRSDAGLPSDIYFYMAYQRQHIPPSQHVDGINRDGDTTYAYTMVVPLDENINGIFKTIVWDKNFITNEDFLEFRNDFIKNEHKYPKISNITEQYDVDHCATGRNLADYIPLDGVYDYELGTGGIFLRTHVHASTNWYKYKVVDYKDIIILHIGG